ncbi:pheromone-regulated protein prm10, partial [Coemansia spiralis]
MSHQPSGSDHESPTPPVAGANSGDERRALSLSPELGAGPRRPTLRLSMLGAQDQATERERARLEHPATAPIQPASIPLPGTGYFAPRGALARASTERQVSPPPPLGDPFAGTAGERAEQPDEPQTKGRRGRPPGTSVQALRFASRDSVHTIHDEPSDDGDDDNSTRRPSRLHTPIDARPAGAGPPTGLGISGGSEMPQGLRRRMTQTRDGLMGIGRAFSLAAAESDTESEPEAGSSVDTEKHMEDLLDKHAANNPEHPPTNNIAANNADITNSPDFYPINQSTLNPGVIHVNMSGDSAAKNIVDSILGAVGTSTAHRGSPQGTGATPADLEAGQGKGWAAHTTAHARPGQAMFRGVDMASLTGFTQSPTTLRSVYADLNKLQSRMFEHQKKREQRMRELQLKEEKRRAESERRREETAKRQREEDAAPHAARASWVQREQAVLGNVGARISEIHDKLAARHKARSMTPRTSPSPGVEPAGGSGSGSVPLPENRSFVVRGSRAMPRPQSVVMAMDSMGLSQPPPGSRTQPTSPFEDTAQFVPTSTYSSPNRSGGPTTTGSPVPTPGWDEVLASSGMLSSRTPPPGVPGSRMSTASMDSTMTAFEAEKLKILAQLSDIFNRQNFLLVASRALMAFGAPLHRLEANLIAIALNLDVQATFAVLPGIMLITFGDEDTRSSETYVVRSVSGYDMYRLGRTNRTIRRVLKGRITVGQGVKNLERVLATPPLYSWWVILLDYVVVSFCICPLFWNGSWEDAGVSAMLGFLIGALQLLAGRFHNYANLFEVSSAFLVSFIAALMQDHVCFATVSFAGIAMLLPGLALTTSIIEMASRNMITGTVRLVFALCRCFMLGYGISVGSTLGTQALGRGTSAQLLHEQIDNGEQAGLCRPGPSQYWWFLLLPMVSLGCNISISAHWRQWPFMMIAGCLAYTVSYFSSLSVALSPLAPAIAAFAMGLFSNVLAAFYNHRSAVEPILGGVLLLVPGSLGLKT